MPRISPRRWPIVAALLSAALLAGCTQGRRGAVAEGGADGFHAAGWAHSDRCAAWHFGSMRWTVSWPVVWSGEAAEGRVGEGGAMEGGADGFVASAVLPQAPGCALAAAAGWSGELPAWTPFAAAAPGPLTLGGAPADEADDGRAGEDAAPGDLRLLPGDLSAFGRDFGMGRAGRASLVPGADPDDPFMSLWPGAMWPGAADAAGQGGRAAAAGTPGDAAPAMETIAVDGVAPVLAPVGSAQPARPPIALSTLTGTAPTTIPEPTTMALLGAALMGLGLLRRWD